MSYSESEIQESVQTVYLNSKRQAKRALVTNFANGDLNFIGDCAFMYSGEISVPHTGTTNAILAEGITGASFLKASVDFGAEATTDNMEWRIMLNDIMIVSVVSREPYDLVAHGYKVIIPPFPKITLRGVNGGGAGARNMLASLTAQVYAGSELIQGAI